MAPLGGVRLWWFSMPGSWPRISPLHEEIQGVLYQGFQEIVFNTVRKGLNVKVSELTGIQRHDVTTEVLGDPAECVAQRAGDPGEPAPLTLAIEEFPEFGRLREQVQRMETLEANLAIFGRLRKGDGEMQDLRALLRYTWRIELPESLDKGGYQTAAMRQGYAFKEKTPGDVFAKAAACAFGQGLDRTYARFFAQNQALLLSQNIAARISALSEAAGDAEREDEPYADLLRQIDALDALLKNPRGRWIATSERDLGPAFDDLLQHVAGVSTLGPRVGEEARAKAQAEIEKLRKSLALLSAEAVGAIVRRAPEGSWALAPDVAGFQTALAMLLKQRFMAEAEGRRLEARVDPGTVIRWEVKRLDEALALAEEQRRYLKDNLGKFPSLLQDDVRAIADRHLARRMTDLVAKAESIVADSPQGRAGGSGPEAAAHANDFDRAGPQLVRLLAVLKEVGADATYEELAGLLKRDAVRGVLAVNRILDSGELYTVRDGNFSWWQGTKNPAVGAFRTADPQALADFLGQQYGQVEWLAKLSASLLAVVDSAGMRLDPEAARVVRRLRGIAREVERFNSKNPKSSVAELEAFVRTDLAEIDAQNCIEKMAPKLGTARDADFFRERQIALRQQLYARCVELAITAASRAYGTIEESFARTLAGRFPFGQPPERGGGGEADPEDVVQFLRLYDRHAKSVLPVMSSTMPSSGTRVNAGRFLEQMTRVRAFLGPLIPPEDGAQPAGYELGIEFRVNQKAEIDGNKIVDWALEVGDQTVKLRDANRPVRWRPGMPIGLTLRWAKDASLAPVNDGTLAHLSVDDKNVIYRFTDPWALVSMLKFHAASPIDAVSRAEVRPHTLKFEFTTQPIPPAGQYRSNLPESRAKVFIRLTVTPGGKKDILSLPVFPAQAPGFAPEPAYGSPGAAAPVEGPGARPGWPDAYAGMRSQPLPEPKPAARRLTGSERNLTSR
jgi:type VI secretion system protein ImpL